VALLPSVSRLSSPSARENREAPALLSSGQQRLWFLHQLNGASGEYHIPEVYRLRGGLDLAALGGALSAIVARHESLRTRFRLAGDQPVQEPVAPRPVGVPVEDVSDLPEAAREEWITRALREEWRRPFDLGAGTLLRARLLRTADAEHVLFLTTHHIASDGWSQGILRRELEVQFAACQGGGEPAALPPLPFQYADYAVWQRSRAEAGALDKALTYWTDQLADLPELLRLPTDRRRGAASMSAGSSGGVLVADLDDELVRALKRVGAASGATLFMVLLAVYAVLLARCSGQHDIAVGTPIAQRTKAPLEGMIGFFAGTVAMRIGVPPGASFPALLSETRRTALRAYEHQEAPFERVVEKLSPRRRLDRTPVFQVMFALGPRPDDRLDLPGLDVTPLDFTEVRARFDLELHVREGSAGTVAHWVYDEALFDRSRIEHMAAEYVRLLERVARAPDIDVADLGLSRPMAPGVATEASAGVLALLAVTAAGATPVPVEPDQPTPRLARLARATDARLALVDDAGRAAMAACAFPALHVLDAVRADPAGLAERDPAPLAYVLFTSGTTDTPKGVEVTQANMLSLLAGASRWDTSTAEDTWACFHAFTFDVSMWEVWRPLSLGATVHVLPRAAQADGDLTHALVDRQRVTSLCQTPTAARLLARTVKEKGVPRSLRRLLLAGERLDFSVLEPLLPEVASGALEVWNMYGPTEATVYATAHRVTTADIEQGTRSLIGRPLPGVGVEIHAPDADGVGELWLSGDAVAAGYRGDPALTATRFVADAGGRRAYRTGDLVRATDGGVRRTRRRLREGARLPRRTRRGRAGPVRARGRRRGGRPGQRRPALGRDDRGGGGDRARGRADGDRATAPRGRVAARLHAAGAHRVPGRVAAARQRQAGPAGATKPRRAHPGRPRMNARD
jgi:non-ribosomal peptide synthetase component F